MSLKVLRFSAWQFLNAHAYNFTGAPVAGRLSVQRCCEADALSSGRCTVTCFSAACRSISLRRLRRNASLSSRVSSSLSASIAVTLHGCKDLTQWRATNRSHARPHVLCMMAVFCMPTAMKQSTEKKLVWQAVCSLIIEAGADHKPLHESPHLLSMQHPLPLRTGRH